MPTTIRLSRAGTKKRPYYRIVVTNSRSARDSNFIERIGTYSPLLDINDEKRVVINTDRAKYWVSTGAQLSDRVHLFFNKAGIVSTKPAQRAARIGKKAAAAAAAGGGEAAAAPAAQEAPASPEAA